MSILLRFLLSIGLSMLVASGAAAPFAQPGDPVLRADLTRLADQGCLATPVTTWPVMWASVAVRDNERCAGRGERLRQRRQAALRPGGTAGLRLAGANQPPILRNRDTQVREEGEAQASLAWQGGHWAARLAATRAASPTDGRRWRADGSYLLGRAGNWSLAAGAVDRWWGPGRHSNLIWSSNARPVPGVWLNRNQATAPTSEWLSWVGPWSLTLFAGQLEQERAVPEAKFFAARVVFRPADSLELGLVRAAQWGGQDRPEDLDSFVNMLAGQDNGQTTGFAEGEDPGNQRAGMDFRWGMLAGAEQTLSLYGQMIGEDEAGYLPSKLNWLAGLDWQFAHPGGRGLLYLEATDTAAGALSGTPRYNTAFEHGTYATGWRYRDRPLASSWGGDSRVASLGARTIGPNQSTLGLMVSRASFNRDARLPAFPGTAPRLEPVRDRTLWIAALEYQRPLWGGELDTGVHWSEEPVPALDARERITLTLGWERKWRF